jgi:hypothetical protein
MGLRDYTLFHIISRNARLYPQRAAIVFEDRRVTHGEYLIRVERLAAGLAAAGSGTGDRIGIVSLNCLEYLDLCGATARLGAIVLPVNWRLSSEEMVQISLQSAGSTGPRHTGNHRPLRGNLPKCEVLGRIRSVRNIGGRDLCAVSRATRICGTTRDIQPCSCGR